ncbi:MAG TPA: fibronectin type III domain-containing protein, partial [Burkholderiales bacterium]
AAALASAVSPAAPSNLGATALSSSRIVLQWTNGSSTQTAIAIERCAGRCRSYSEIARVAGSAASFTDGGLAARTSYTYRVRAFNGTVSSPYSASVTAKTPR